MSFKRCFCLVICVLLLLSALPFSSAAAFSGDDKVVIVLDPGHGGANVGSAAYGVGEKVYTLRLATCLKQYLEENGSFTVRMTREGDTDLELCERGILANDFNADALISIHFDGSTDPSQHGVTVYTSVFDSAALVDLGSSVASAVAASVGMSSNGVKRKADYDGYYWNSERQWDIQDPSLGILSDHYGIPTWGAKFGYRAMIVEHGFMSSPYDRDIISAEGSIEKMARAEADAIIAYYTNHTHTYGAARRDYASNCMFRGKQSEHCTICDHRRNITLLDPAPDNHYWQEAEVTPASCGRDGSIVRICRITDNLIKKHYKNVTNHEEVQIIPAPSQHSFTEIGRQPASHTKDGYIQYRCENCGESFKDILYAEGHSYESAGHRDPTCTENGGYVYRCSVCGDEYTDVDAAALGHSFEVTDEAAPTCTEAGYKTSACTTCGTTVTEDYAALGHDTSICTKIEATCTENGVLKGSCAVCSTEINEIYKAPGHNFTSNITKSPECVTDGEESRVCSVCGYSDIHIISALRHDCRITDYKAPTCSEQGAAQFVCSRCGEAFGGSVKADGHNMKIESKTDSGLFTRGTRVLVCTSCGERVSEKIPFTAGDIIVRAFSAVAFAMLAASVALLATTLIRKRHKLCVSDSDTPNADTAVENEDVNLNV